MGTFCRIGGYFWAIHLEVVHVSFSKSDFFVISSAPVYITLPSPGIIMMCPSHHHHHLQCVSYIFVYFEQFSSKISANFSL